MGSLAVVCALACSSSLCLSCLAMSSLPAPFSLPIFPRTPTLSRSHPRSSCCHSSSGAQARLAVNAVIVGDMQRPARIAAFLGELNNGFRLLNFKNDNLRKRYDGLKYDIKRVEGVVYDVSIRGLAGPKRA